MKMKKILALGMSMAMVFGAVACSSTETDSTTAATTTAAPVEETKKDDTEESKAPEVQVDEEGGLVGFTDLGAATVENEGDKILVWSWNDELDGIIKNYATVKDYDYEAVGGGNQSAYTQALDNALSAGEAPDLFALDLDYAKKYSNSNDTLAINDLGIDYKDLTNMYAYTLYYGADDEGVIKTLAWQANPAGVYYNRTIAQEYLGVSEPEDVAEYFASWDKILETARDLKEKSNGEVKIASSVDDFGTPFKYCRSSAWIVDGEVKVDPVLDDYLELGKILKQEELTHDTGMWNTNWTNNASNDSTLAYFGPMWLSWSLELRNEDNPTYGNWGFVNAPDDYFWGGTFLMASATCDMRKDAGQIIYDVCVDQDILKSINEIGGDYVNSMPIMKAAADDANTSVEWLGGQNPFPLLTGIADGIDASKISANDGVIWDNFGAAAGSYFSGDIETIADAKATFEASIKDAGII